MSTTQNRIALAAAAFIAAGAVPAQAQMFRNGGFHTVGRHLVAPAPVDSVFDQTTAAELSRGAPPFDIYADFYPNYRRVYVLPGNRLR